MKLRSQILGLGFTGVLVSVLVGGVGLINSNRISNAFDESITTSFRPVRAASRLDLPALY
jgi:ABC-type lipoprotein release transport system permease subunit